MRNRYVKCPNTYGYERQSYPDWALVNSTNATSFRFDDGFDVVRYNSR